jgi:hypothetical protein
MWILLVMVSWRRLSCDFSHVLAIEAKNIFGKPRFPVGHPGRRARGAAAELDEPLGTGLTSVSEWAAEWQSLLPWRSVLPWQ